MEEKELEPEPRRHVTHRRLPAYSPQNHVLFMLRHAISGAQARGESYAEVRLGQYSQPHLVDALQYIARAHSPPTLAWTVEEGHRYSYSRHAVGRHYTVAMQW